MKNVQGLRERLKTTEESLEQLQAAQGFDLTAVEQIRTVEVPQAELAIEVARTQLDFIQAAVDDHAKRLRLTLQDGKECPVCGSTSHPYSQHAPEMEATAVKAAKKSVKDLEKKRDEALSRESRLHGSMETRRQQIDAISQELAILKSEVADITMDYPDHPEVEAMLAIEEDVRLPVMESRLLEINGELRMIEKMEQAARNAAKRTSDCRDALQNSQTALKELDDRLQAMTANRDILNETSNNAAVALRKAEDHRATADDRMSDLWLGLPAAKQDFEADAAAFRHAFERSANECGDIEKRIADVTSLIQQADAAIRPLEQSVMDARTSAMASAAAFADISKDLDECLKERSQLFDGRAADLVEEEFQHLLAEAFRCLEEAVGVRTEADKSRVAAKSEFDTRTQSAEGAKSVLAAATSVRERWMEAFTARTSTSLSLQELDGLLARDETWIRAERFALQQLDEAVTAADSACRIYVQQFQQHDAAPPTQEDEQTVLLALQAMNQELTQAKTTLNAAHAVLLSDDTRRVQNVELMKRIELQDAKADPWRKLNELIGSKEGDKFRIIAQRRTLDVLLGYANQQLNQLSARYRLERLPESLNLIVIDCDMGEERRSIHSLSGGESFLVSLALALGLASLTSNRLRIESLFIDEGFGSLDPETLTVAMNALTHLESQGRKVGVISHVTEMTDAIPVQIRIEKRRSGGASRIVIPGADPKHVSPTTDFETGLKISAAKPSGAVRSSAAVSGNSDEVQAAAVAIMEILQREMLMGKQKVSTTALRKEIGCSVKCFGAAQDRLGPKIAIDGRSLRLAET
ncbi:MAG: SbcC/MukB-like Walker B domain-containing protein [Planctomycetaceae bacterium]